MKPSFWDFHTQGDESCDGCAIPPTQHLETHYRGKSKHCGGFLHTQFNVSLDATETKCDQCSLLLPAPAIG